MLYHDYIYDIETYPNAFTVVFIKPSAKQIRIFEISTRKDDTKKLRAFMTSLWKEKARMVGFNNLGFDYPVLHWWLKNSKALKITPDMIYRYAMDIIENMKDGGFGSTIPEDQHFIKQIDLYKMWHFDNKAKSTSLKMIEFNLRSKSIEDLPFPVGTVLSDDQIDVLIKYNIADVKNTFKFYRYSKDAMELRETLSSEYGIDCMNFNDTKIGKEYFIKQLEEENPGCCYSYSGGRRKMNQTRRKSIDLSEIVFDYIKFETPQFNSVLEWIKNQVITETKGVFSDIPEHELGDLSKYCEMVTKKKKLKVDGESSKDEAKELRKQLKDCEDDELRENIRDKICGRPIQGEVDKLLSRYPKGWVERVVLKSGKVSYYFMWKEAESLNCVVDGMAYVFGLGGIHASRECVTYTSDEDYVILDFDYASMYPNIFMANNVFPEHLGFKFCEIYKSVYQKRRSFAKGTPQNLVMKLALNGTYGATNDKFSPFYDPKATMTITVNGQLILFKLVEKLSGISGLEMIQANTDGITLRCKRSDESLVDSIIKEWDQVTGLEMEKVEYDQMSIRDVNNYVAVYRDKDGNKKYKRNGTYEYKIGHIDGEGLGFHQNQSALIIKKAAFDFITEGESVRETIVNHSDPFDFCLRTKVPRNSRLITVDEEGIEYEEQNICRYFISNEGRKLVKIMPGLNEGDDERRFGINRDQNVKTCNNINDFDWSVDYEYYIEEAIKLVEGVGLS